MLLAVSTDAAVIGSSEAANSFLKKVRELDHMSQVIKTHTNPDEDDVSEREVKVPQFNINSGKNDKIITQFS